MWISRNFLPPAFWRAGNYNIHSVVRYRDVAYRAVTTHTSSSPPPGSANWIRIHYLPTVDYSPLTKDKAQYWINSFGGGRYARSSDPATATTHNQRTAMIDPNVIIKHAKHPRTWVDRVVSDPTDIPVTEKLDETKYVNTYRVLVMDPSTGTGTGTGDFAGSDRNGIAYAGRVVEWEDEDGDGVGEWVVLTFIRCNDDQEIYEWNEDISWTKNPVIGAGSFIDVTDQMYHGSRSTVWVKGAYRLSEIVFVNGAYDLIVAFSR